MTNRKQAPASALRAGVHHVVHRNGKAVLRYGQQEQIVDVTYKESKTPAMQDGHAASFLPVGIKTMKVMFTESYWSREPKRPVDCGDGVTLALRFDVTAVEVWSDVVRLCVTLAERDSGEPIELWFNVFDDGAGRTEERLKYALMRFFEHELDEVIRVWGQRVREPHDAWGMAR